MDRARARARMRDQACRRSRDARARARARDASESSTPDDGCARAAGQLLRARVARARGGYDAVDGYDDRRRWCASVRDDRIRARARYDRRESVDQWRRAQMIDSVVR